MQAVHNPTSSALTLTITDEGRWRETDPGSATGTRGRGIPLMRGLADQASIDTSAQGTTVRLLFNDVPVAASFSSAEVPDLWSLQAHKTTNHRHVSAGGQGDGACVRLSQVGRSWRLVCGTGACMTPSRQFNHVQRWVSTLHRKASRYA